MNEARCLGCKYTFFKYEGQLEAEVICPNCRRINYAGRVDMVVGLKGVDFQSKAVAHNCSKCTRLLFLTIGLGVIENAICKYCKTRNNYDTVVMRKIKNRANFYASTPVSN